MNLEVVLWDWNGTLFDDVDACVQTMNELLDKRGLCRLTRQKYREIFSFPVRDYYALAGIDLKMESYEDLAKEFVQGYNRNFKQCCLYKDAKEALELFKCRNIVLSAAENKMLQLQIKPFGIENYFERLLAAQDYYANGKLDVAQKWIEESKVDASRLLVIGDTLHDFEVASRLGCECYLIAEGHQSQEVLRSKCKNVFLSLRELIDAKIT